MSQKHKSKKTLLSPDEKLWRRISSKFGKDEDKWDMSWNSSKIYSFFVEKEKKLFIYAQVVKESLWVL